MENVFTVAVIFICSVKMIELFVHRKERIELVRKLDSLDLSKENNLDLGKIFGGDSSRFWPIRVGSLIIGLGIGLLVGYLINYGVGNFIPDNVYYDDAVGVVYGASVLLFGGLGLLLSYFLEKKSRAKKQ